ncbi:hypothetical protein BU17DRAFT_81596 [Hysterangium stoloniferum]|nr:hypothetical protein BU17DRAFT_81596 [Hysterangium stoloniferum]
MGRSAKTHKRVHKKVSQLQPSKQPAAPKASATPGQVAPNAQTKRKNNLKGKARTTQSNKEGTVESVLGGVDYVTLMMGGRRKAQGEANKIVED